LDIHWGIAADAIVHSEVPAQAVVAGEVGGVRAALKERPSLPIRAGGISVVDWRLAGSGLIAGGIEPGFDSEWLGIGRIERWIERNFCARREVEELGTIRIADDRAREWMDDSGRRLAAFEIHRIIGRVSGRAQRPEVLVYERSDVGIVEMIVRLGMITLDERGIIGSSHRDCEKRRCSDQERPVPTPVD